MLPSGRRLRRHLILAALSLILVAVVVAAFHTQDPRQRLSVATAYASLALLVYVLLIGPLNVIRGRPNPVSTNLRRDTAIWGGMLGLAHVIIGLQVHLHGKMLQYFFNPPEKAARIPLRLDGFGMANDSGLVAALLLVLLLALSNDLSLRRLGTSRWKALQRTNYVAMALVVGHGALYQLAERRTLDFVALFAALALVAIGAQLVGFRRTQDRAIMRRGSTTE